MAMLRTYLTLGRVSNLPTVWSNCLAGWLLGGGGAWDRLLLVGMGGTFLYLAGMYLNDAFDAQWDQQRRPERPIPSGAIALTEVWQLGLLGMAAGVGTLALLGRTSTILALLLATCILIYDAIHKIFAFSPTLMAVCRMLLVLAGASSGDAGITGLAIWSALALAGYVVGLSFLAQTETTQVSLRYWPCLFLGAPVVLALIVNRGDAQWPALLWSGVLGIWALSCLRSACRAPQRNVAHSVAGLLAGIVLVDLLAVCVVPLAFGTAFVGLFVGALFLQRLIPAT